AFRRAVEVAPTSKSAHLNLANFLWATGQRADAEREMKAALEIEPKASDVNRTLAAFHTISGKFADAQPYLETYAAVTPGVNPKITLADFYLAVGKTKEGIGALEALAKDPDGFGAAKLRLAIIDFQAGRR